MACIVYKLYISGAITAHTRGRHAYDNSHTVLYIAA